jgi:hypothetical protein
MHGCRTDGNVGGDMGLVYYYTSSDGQSWSCQQEIKPEEGNSYDYFGSAVALYHKNKAAIGAWGSDLAAGGGGVVYTYRMVDSQWSQYSRLLSPEPASSEWYGGSISIDQHYLAIGAIGNSNGGAMAGAVYVYSDYDSYEWALQKKLYGETSDSFGKAIAVHGDILVIGSPSAYRRKTNSYDMYSQRTGRVSVYRVKNFNNWYFEESIVCVDCEIGDVFGLSVDVNGESGTIVIGKKSGAYVYQYAIASAAGYRWADETVLTPPKGLVKVDTSYGVAVALSDTAAVVGSRDEAGRGGTQSGMAFAFVGFASSHDDSADALLQQEIFIYEILYSIIGFGLVVLIVLLGVMVFQIITDTLKDDVKVVTQKDHKPLIR